MTPKEAIAIHLGWDISEVEFYQPGVWDRRIVATENEWYCATKSCKAPSVKSRDGISLQDWKLAESFGNINVWKIEV